MVKTKEEIMNFIKEKFSEDTSDEVIEFIENLSDTLDDKGDEDWKTKFEENDKAWRKKYRDRFFGKTKEDEEIEDDDIEEIKSLKFEDLFKEEDK